MAKLEDSKDIRIQILLYLEDGDFSHEQIPANEFLATLKTINGNGDLGTIRRSLQDLFESKLIMGTTTSSERIINGCDLVTTGQALKDCGFGDYTKERTNPARFNHAVGNADVIPDVFLGITLKGKKFLTEMRNSWSTYELAKRSIDDYEFNKKVQESQRKLNKSQKILNEKIEKELETNNKWYNHPITHVMIGAVLATAGGWLQSYTEKDQIKRRVYLEDSDVFENIHVTIDNDSLTISPTKWDPFCNPLKFSRTFPKRTARLLTHNVIIADLRHRSRVLMLLTIILL